MTDNSSYKTASRIYNCAFSERKIFIPQRNRKSDHNLIINSTTNNNITIINNILNSQKKSLVIDNTNDLTIKKSNLKNFFCSPPKKVNFDIQDFYGDKMPRPMKLFESSDIIKRHQTNFIPYIEEDINLKSTDENTQPYNSTEHSKEEIKLLYKSKGDCCIYDKPFGQFYGFFATTFKNYKKENEDKIRISINNPIEEQKEEKTNNIINGSETPSKIAVNLLLESNFSSSKSSSSLFDSITTNNIHFFGLYDGHKGSFTSQFLKDNLHKELFKNIPLLTKRPFYRITSTFQSIDSYLLSKCDIPSQEFKFYDKSGSCANIFISFNNKIFVANCGDSRSIISQNLGGQISQLSIDHKPTVPTEKIRIENSGGKIIPIQDSNRTIYRVLPGGLNVTRTLGDFDIKSPSKGGILNLITSFPDIIEIDIKNDMDFILIGCDGIFDKLSNKDITLIILQTVKQCILRKTSYNSMLTIIGRNIINNAIDNGSRDNLSLILIIMNNLYQCIQNKQVDKINKALMDMKCSVDSCDSLYSNWINYQGDNNSFSHTVIENDIARKTSSLAFDNAEKKENIKINTPKKKRKFSFWQLLGDCRCSCK